MILLACFIFSLCRKGGSICQVRNNLNINCICRSTRNLQNFSRLHGCCNKRHSSKCSNKTIITKCTQSFCLLFITGKQIFITLSCRSISDYIITTIDETIKDFPAASHFSICGVYREIRKFRNFCTVAVATTFESIISRTVTHKIEVQSILIPSIT